MSEHARALKPEVFLGRPDSTELARWLFQLRQYFILTKVAEDSEKIAYAAALFRDDAIDWWLGVLNGRDAPPSDTTWDQFVALLQAKFAPLNDAEVARSDMDRLRLARCKSITEYNQLFTRYAARIRTLPEPDQVHRYMAGLTPKVRQAFGGEMPDTVVTAMRRAERSFRVDGMFAAGETGPVPMELGMMELTAQLNRMQMRKGQHRYSVQRQQREAGAPDEEGYGGPLCWVCGSPQHLARVCPEKYSRKSSRKQ